MKSMVQRYFWFFIGVAINSFGVAFITQAALGTSPISSVPYVLSLKFTPTLGQFTFVFNLLFILIQFLLLRKRFPPIQFLQIVVNLFFSACLDVSMDLLAFLQPEHFLARLVCLLIGCAVLALGISIEVAPNVLMVPGEGIVKALAVVTGKRFGSIKVLFDVTLILIAVILSLLFFHRLNGLGLGTIVSALIVGQIVNFINRHFPAISRISALAEA
ncbi:YitT family protein [Pseudoflavonifractor phocaeensis]|uniref:YczE/YyaS/YitT family protein n=2 Tax=Pseudoflavonifractor phocaeensis TaxID=1870988 RepID=UPI0019599E2D|nr:DUF6198 family protein [Pseudoflavonifractor phocaeensis]MBM6869025.1 YitT family protein [Pseudoflavonifractor phocaeensis]MBM6937191.1 YitT family protein [Pseudoflavonifractor phocaeensis]